MTTLTRPVVANFLKTLGTQILSVNAQGIAINSTPSKPRRIDLIAVRNALKELAQTEESYLQKMTTLLEVRPSLLLSPRSADGLVQQFAVPLRRSASLRQGPISVEEARVLFSNIEQLVPLSQRFHEGLNEMLEELEMDTMYLPATFGRMILDNVGPPSSESKLMLIRLVRCDRWVLSERISREMPLLNDCTPN